jgi:RimJ/RimL family protein N-acetyltransferase
MPSIKKAGKIIGRNLVFRNAGVNDAGFILSLRTDQHKNRFLSPTSPEIEKQVEWMRKYENATDQAYFVIENTTGEKVGTIRLYDQVGDSFCWGSWIIKDGAPFNYAVESVTILYQYALHDLGFSRSYFAVRKANRSVWQFMERFGAERKTETDVDYLYETGREKIQQSLRRYSKFLPRPIRVINDPISGSGQT